MLKLRRPAIGALVLLVFSIASTSVGMGAARDDRPPKPGPEYVWVCVQRTGSCMWILKTSVDPPGTTPKTGDKGGKRRKRVCEAGGAAQACTSVLGNWSNSQQCYLQSLDAQPPATDPAWQGHTDGAIWACVVEKGYDEGRHLVTKWVWLPGPPDTVVTDPVTLAYQAIALMDLQGPQVRSAPGVGQVGLVNMPVWLWVEKSENTFGPITKWAEVPGLRVTATGVVKAINWNMGDGKTIRCEGPGTPYSKGKGIADSPDCGHRYRKTSHKQPKCQYPVSATAEWSITWQSTLGDTGQIDMTQQAATQLRIGEAVPVLVDPDGSQATRPTPANC